MKREISENDVDVFLN